MYLNRTSALTPLNVLMVVMFCASTFLLVVKSWITITLILLAVYAVITIIQDKKSYFSTENIKLLVPILALLSPFFAELCSQLARGSLVPSSLDGPSRGILAACVFVLFTRFEVTKLAHALSYGCFMGILFVFFSLIIFPEQYWGSRAATYFVDPITLPCFTVMLFGMLLFLERDTKFTLTHILLKTLAGLATIFIAIESGSRSSWVALVSLLIVFVIYISRGSLKRLAVGSVILTIFIIVVYGLSPTVKERTDKSINVISQITTYLVSGDYQDESLNEAMTRTSTGHRMILFLVDWELIKLAPLWGTPDGILPDFETLHSDIPFLTEDIYEIKLLAGSHSEMSAILVRRGVLLGVLSLWGLFLYPIYLVMRSIIDEGGNRRSISWIAMGGILPVLASALTIQVFNLKMTTSFYWLCCAIFMAYYFAKPTIQKTDSNSKIWNSKFVPKG